MWDERLRIVAVLAMTAGHTHRKARYLAPLSVAGGVAAIVVVALAANGHSWWVTSALDHFATGHARPAASAHAVANWLPPYWIVRPGDTFGQIAQKTGLSVDQLQAYNPAADPAGLVPGERLNLWARPPRPRPKPLGPRFWIVQAGQSFGFIAAKTTISLSTLEELNPRLKPATLQPGDRVRLR